VKDVDTEVDTPFLPGKPTIQILDITGLEELAVALC
jgi:hypothetical protein